MKNKKIFLLVVLLFFCNLVSAQDNKSLEKQIQEIEKSVKGLEQRNKESLKTIEVLKHEDVLQKSLIDSLQIELKKNEKRTEKISANLDNKIKQTDSKTNKLSKGVKNKTIIGIIVIILVLCISLVIAYLLHKKQRKDSESKILGLQEKSEELNEKIVSQLQVDAKEIENISSSLVNLSTIDKKEEINHDLIKILADKITFMEITLYRMDSSVKGHKQLSKSIKQMKDNLLANGYEIVEMLGKPYNDGMKVTATFTEDENLKDGEQIITGIIKPQINYKGKMIQAAQITVSQN